MYNSNAKPVFSASSLFKYSKTNVDIDNFDRLSVQTDGAPQDFTPVKPSTSPNCSKVFVFIVVGVIVAIVAVAVTVPLVLNLTDEIEDSPADKAENSSPVSVTSTPLSTDFVDTSIPTRAPTISTSVSSGLPSSTSSTTTTGSLQNNWLSWGSWTECSSSCGSGIHKRYRTCNVTQCYGDYVDTQLCFTTACPVYGHWTTWSSWGSCDVSCGGGIWTRYRTCSKVNSYDLDCVGSETQLGTCSEWNCPDCTQTCVVGNLNAACDTCICEDTVVTGRVLAQGTGFPISNAALYAATAPTTLLTTSDSLGKFTLDGTCITSQLFATRTGFQDRILTIEQSQTDIYMTEIVLPYLRQEPQSKQRLTGENVTFCCSAVATPDMTYYEWMKDSITLDHDNNSLTIWNVSIADQGNYQCRANSPAGAIMSEAATLTVKENSDAFCHDALQQKMVSLPDDCIQKENNVTSIEIGDCIARGCRGNNAGGDSSCEDEIRSCCAIAEADLLTVQCSGYELEFVVVKSCTCSVCHSNKLTVDLKAVSSDGESPVKFGSVFVNGHLEGYTSVSGKFSKTLPKMTSKLTINIQDNFFRHFLPAVKVIKLAYDISGKINIEIPMYRKTEPIQIDPGTENTLLAGSSSDNESIPIVQVSIPANAFFYPNGSQYTGTVQASLTFLDPKNSTIFQNIPGLFQFVDGEGVTGNLASLGVFNIYFSDNSNNALVLDEVLDLFIPKETNIAEEDIKLWRLNSESGLWEYVPSGTGTRRRKRQTTAYWVGEIDFSSVSYQYWWNYDMVAQNTDKPCFFKVRLFKDARLTANVPDPKKVVTLEYHILKNNILTTVYDYFSNPEVHCSPGICENDKVYISMLYWGRYGYDELYAGNPQLGSDNIPYTVSNDSKVLSIKMSSSVTGPFYESKTTCLISSKDDNHLKYHFGQTSDVYTFLLKFILIQELSVQELDKMSQKTWYPQHDDGYHVCFIKIRILLEQPTFLTPGQYMKIKVISSGGTNINIANETLGIREQDIDHTKNADSFCIEYKCSGPIISFSGGPETTDSTNITIQVVYPQSGVLCRVSNEADYVSDDITRKNYYQNNTRVGRYEFYAPSFSASHLGLYSSTSGEIEDAQTFAEWKCKTGENQYIQGANENPEEGVGVTFSCGGRSYVFG